jgi:hypothetical protein
MSEGTDAVDLVTGRLLPFTGDVKVMPVEAKLNIDAFLSTPSDSLKERKHESNNQ